MDKILILFVVAFALNNVYAIAQWQECNKGLQAYEVNTIVISDSNIFAGFQDGGIYLSTDNGNNWSIKTDGSHKTNIKSLAINGNFIFAAIHDFDSAGIYLSTDNGNSWSLKNNGLKSRFFNIITISGNNILIGGNGSGVFLSEDNGNSWSAKNNGLSSGSKVIYTIAINGNNIFVGTIIGICLSEDYGNSWKVKNNGLEAIVYSIAIKDNNIFAGTNDGIYLSADNGNSWTKKNEGLKNSDVQTIAINGNNIFVGTFNGIFLSTDNGNSWSPKNNGLINTNINSLAISGNDIYAGTRGYGVFKAKIDELLVTNVLESTKENNFTLYPNPTNDYVYLHGLDCIAVQIYSVTGMLIKEQKLNGANGATIDVSEFPSGVYFMRCGLRIQKIIKW